MPLISTISANTTITNATISSYTWPVTINGGTSTNTVIVKFGDALTFTSNTNLYFIIGSDYITIDGQGYVVTLNAIDGYPGLVQNGTSANSAKSYINVQNIGISVTSTNMVTIGGGWIGQTYYGNSANNNNIINCYNSNGAILKEGGGIVGSYAGYGGGTITVYNCYNGGTIGNATGGVSSAGGIFGHYAGGSGYAYATNCYNIGDLNGYSTGGIFGYYSGTDPGSHAIALNCYNKGNINQATSGGIFAGNATGENDGTITATNCYNTGAIINGAGGIFGNQIGNPQLSVTNGRLIKATNCYSIGAIGGSTAGGIFGGTAYSPATAERCYVVSTSNASIFGSGGSGITTTQPCSAVTAWLDSGANAVFSGLADGASNVWLDLNNAANATNERYFLTYNCTAELITKFGSLATATTKFKALTGFTETDPTINIVGTPNNNATPIAFTKATCNKNVITNYKYSINGGTNWYLFYPPLDANSVNANVPGISSSASILIRAVNVIDLNASNTYNYTYSAPTILSANTIITNATLSSYVWPVTINGGTSSNTVIVKFGDALTLTIPSQYFIIGSDYVTIDGQGYMVTLNSIAGYYPGLVQNGTGVIPNVTFNINTYDITPIGMTFISDNKNNLTNAYGNINIQNIGITISGNTTLADHGGWICQCFFGSIISNATVLVRHLQNINIINCYNINGTISRYGGGIIGSFSAYGSTEITVYNCYNLGNIGIGIGNGDDTFYIGGGGIIGAFAGHETGIWTASKLTIINCYNKGNILANGAGGIVGSMSGFSGNILVKNCYCIVDVSIYKYCGGIVGSFAGEAYASSIIVNNCYSNVIMNNPAGGIFGNYTGGILTYYSSMQVVAPSITANNCYSTCSIPASTTGLGFIFGNNSISPSVAVNCYVVSTNATKGFIYGTGSTVTTTPSTCAIDISWTDVSANRVLTGTLDGASNVWLDLNNAANATNERYFLTSNCSAELITRFGDLATATTKFKALSGYTETAPTINSVGIFDLSNTPIRFTPATCSKNVITNYKYSINGGTWTLHYPPLTSTSTVLFIPRITSTINLQIRAVDVIDLPVSNTFQVLPPTIPSAPTILSVTPGNTTATITFTKLEADGGATITRYEYSKDSTTVWTPISISSDSFILTGLMNGTTYTIRLRAVNIVGNGTDASRTVTPATKPSPPTGLVATPGNTTATITFTKLTTDGGASISDYKYSINSTTVETSIGILSNSFNVTGLTNGVLATIYLRAVNSEGNGDPASITVTPMAPVTVPSAPTGLVATPTILNAAAGNQIVTITFTKLTTDGGASISDYKYSIDSTTVGTSIGILNNSFNVTGLTNGTTYTIRLLAVNSAGDGTIASISVTPPTVPSAPTILTTTPGNTTATITFTKLTTDGGETATITRYEYFKDSTTGWIPIGISSNSFTVTGLTNGVLATIQLRAVNSAGDGIPVSFNVTPPTVPSAPTILSATPIIPNAAPGNQIVTITFTKLDSDGGASITDYKYSINGSGEISIGTSSNSFNVTGLTNGVLATIQLRAVNSAGDGTPVSFKVTPPTIPSAPTGLVATPIIQNATAGNQIVTITFTKLTTDGGADITDYKYSINGSGEISIGTSSNSFNVFGLTNGVLATIQLRAVNSAGLGTPVSFNVTPPTVPSAPTGLVATPIIPNAAPGNQTVKITFTKLTTDGGANIIRYEYYSININDWVSIGILDNSFNVTGLTNGAEVTIQLRAVNSAGNGTVASKTVTPPTVPSAPTGLVATPIIPNAAPGNQTVTITFTKLTTDGGANIIRYEYSTDNNNWTPTGTSTNSFNVTGLTNGVQSTIQLRAVNSAGDGTPASKTVTPPTVPSAPTGLVATPTILNATAGNQILKVTFTKLTTDGGASITDYKYSIDNTTVGTSIGILDNSFNVTGLTNGTTYRIRLLAVNSAGNGTVASIDVTPPTVPSAPIILTPIAGNGSISVPFTQNTTEIASILNYKYSLNGGSYIIFNPPQIASPVTIVNLNNGIPYYIKLIAVNVAGDSVESNQSITVTPTKGVSAPNLTSATGGNGSITINFDAIDTGGATITRYEYSTAFGTNWLSVIPTNVLSLTSVKITNLSNGQLYSIQLRVVTTINGIESTGSNSNTLSAMPTTIPFAPTSLAATLGNNIINISFTAGDTGGSSITNYQYSTDNGANYVAFSPVYTGSPVVITKQSTTGTPSLVNGTQYNIKLRAVNANGLGAESVAIQVTPATTPSAPTTLSYAPGDQQVTINFTSGYNGGNSISGYSYSINFGNWRTDNITYTSPNNFVIISGLINGTPVQISLLPRNIIGDGVGSVAISVTPSTTPSAPISLIATPGNGQVTIAITEGFNGGSPITSYMYAIIANTWRSDNITYTSSPNAIVTITGLTNGILYNIYVRPKNARGDGIESTVVAVRPVTVPSAPTSLALISEGNQQVTIGFTPGNTEGSPITNYKYSTDNGANYVAFSPVYTGSPVVITKQSTTGTPSLVNGTQYNIKLRAVNAVGDGIVSEVVVAMPRFTPNNPIITFAIPNNQAATIYFTPGLSNGYPITNYKYSTNGGGNYIEFSPVDTDSPVTVTTLSTDGITRLVNGTQYIISLLARNFLGDGEKSTPISVTPYTGPSAPTNLIPSTESQRTTITFTPGYNGGSPITSYQYSIDDGTNWTQQNLTFTNTSVTIINLTNKTKYIIRLRAVNLSTGDPSLPIDVTPASVPSAPTSLTTPDNGTATIYFTPGDNGGAPITGYKYNINGGLWIGTNITYNAPNSVIITDVNLQNGITYSIKIKAVNITGDGSESLPIQITPAIIPSAPTSLSYKVESSQATITFTAPYDGGAAITNYQYSFDNNLNWTSFTPPDNASPVIITNLINGTTYNVNLRATNKAGNGSASSPITIIPATIPDSPTNLTPIRGNGQVDIAFNLVSNGGRSIKTYEYSFNTNPRNWNSIYTNATDYILDNTSPVTIRGLTNGVEYSILLRAVNTLDWSGNESLPASVTPATFPSKPANLLASRGDKRVVISFTLDSSGGDAITNYEYSTNNGTTYAPFNPSIITSPVTITTLSTDGITNLTNGTPYNIKIRAVNTVGSGGESDLLSNIITATTPAAPTALAIADASNGYIKVSFIEGNNGGDAITNYEYFTDRANTWRPFNPSINTSPVKITDLSNGLIYNIKLRAVNGIGSGVPSSSISGKPVNTPSKPTNIAAIIGSNQTTITFIDGSNNGYDITNYEYSKDNGLNWTAFYPSNNTSPVTITGLINEVQYNIKLRAVNQLGYGEESVTIQVTPADVPDAPTLLTSTIENGQTTIVFTKGNTHGNPILKYNYRLNGADLIYELNDDTSPVTITGLINGTIYTIQLRPVNQRGIGPFSNSIQVTPKAVPFAPINLIGYGENNQVTIFYDMSNVAITYWEYSFDSGANWLQNDISQNTVHSVTIKKLTNNQTYNINLRAFNNYGSGPESTTISVTALAVPDAPTILSASHENTKTTLIFTPGNNNGSNITGYKYSKDYGKTIINTDMSSEIKTIRYADVIKKELIDASSVIISGLDNAITYNIQLFAINSVGIGAASSSIPVDPDPVPDAPTGISIRTENGQATVTIIQGADNGARIDYYQYSIDGGITWQTLITL